MVCLTAPQRTLRDSRAELPRGSGYDDLKLKTCYVWPPRFRSKSETSPPIRVVSCRYFRESRAIRNRLSVRPPS
jgi:hypothetical protein